MTPPPEPQTYAVRLSAQANRDVVEATVRLAELTEDLVFAKRWSEELLTEIGTLATLPLRYATVKRESQLLRRSLRRMVFRRNARSGMAYHIYYEVSEAGDDGPTVTILFVRHASRKPLTRAEARALLGDE